MLTQCQRLRDMAALLPPISTGAPGFAGDSRRPCDYFHCHPAHLQIPAPTSIPSLFGQQEMACLASSALTHQLSLNNSSDVSEAHWLFVPLRPNQGLSPTSHGLPWSGDLCALPLPCFSIHSPAPGWVGRPPSPPSLSRLTSKVGLYIQATLAL